MEPSYDNSFSGTNPGGMNPGVGDGAVPQMNAGEIGVNQVSQMNQVPQMNPVLQTNPGGMDTMQQMGSGTMNPGVMNPMQQINPGMMNPGEMNPMQQMNTEGMNPGGFPENSMPVSSGTGDVILGDDGKKGKKWLIVVGLVIAIAVIGLLVWLFVLSSGGMGGQSSFNSGNRIETFDRFANYILSGNEDGVFPDEKYDRNSYYALEKAIAEHNENYLVGANRLFDEFMKGIDLESSDSINKVISNYDSDWKIIYTFGKNRLRSENEFLEYYMENGSTATYELIGIEKNALILFGDERADKLAELYSNYEGSLFKQLSIIEGFGCIREKQLDENCIDTIEKTPEQVESTIKGITDKDEADQMVDSLLRFFIQDLWVMREVLDYE